MLIFFYLFMVFCWIWLFRFLCGCFFGLWGIPDAFDLLSFVWVLFCRWEMEEKERKFWILLFRDEIWIRNVDIERPLVFLRRLWWKIGDLKILFLFPFFLYLSCLVFSWLICWWELYQKCKKTLGCHKIYGFWSFVVQKMNNSSDHVS